MIRTPKWPFTEHYVCKGKLFGFRLICTSCAELLLFFSVSRHNLGVQKTNPEFPVLQTFTFSKSLFHPTCSLALVAFKERHLLDTGKKPRFLIIRQYTHISWAAWRIYCALLHSQTPLQPYCCAQGRLKIKQTSPALPNAVTRNSHWRNCWLISAPILLPLT